MAKEVIEIQRVRKLYSFTGYFQRYFEILQETPSYNYGQAYEKLEAEFEYIFGYRRYISYQSFMRAKDYHREKLKAIIY